MRLMDDPDVKKSMHDLWIQEGKTKAKVFVAKFEEMGEIDFNYADGTSKFTEKICTSRTTLEDLNIKKTLMLKHHYHR